MRSFITATLILLVVVGLVITNSILISHKTDFLLSLLEQAENDSSALTYFIGEWQNCRFYYSLTVNAADIETVDALILSLYYANSRKDTEYLGKCAALRRELLKITLSQKLSFDKLL